MGTGGVIALTLIAWVWSLWIIGKIEKRYDKKRKR